MRNLFAITLLLICQILVGQDRYQYSIDLTNDVNDQLTVELKTPVFTETEAIFYLPKMVPGTYSIYDFGRFVKNFQAFDELGNSLPVTLLDTNSILIRQADKLKKVVYKLNDSFDDDGEPQIFQPAGTNFDKGKNYLLNTFGVFGYFKGKINLPFDIYIKKPEGFYGSSPMQISGTDKNNTDLFQSQGYNQLADMPIMYSIPDTATLSVGKTTVLFSIYSEDGKKYAKPLSKKLSKIVDAALSYLNGQLPVEKYAFIIYLFDPMAERNTAIYGAGALEHNSSSVYFMPIQEEEELLKSMADVAAHEFLHIITPLNIHSEEIGYFDFQNPTMSKHLWLYEGSTEYNAHYVQLRAGLTSLQDFVNEMKSKIRISRQNFNDTMPFTELSLNALELQDDYLNVYMKGALINWCLDIELKDLSDGKYGLQELIQDLSARYGQDKPFKDEELFDVITELSYPEIRTFFTKYVEGSEPLPLETTLNKIGIKYSLSEKDLGYSFGFSKPGFDYEQGKLKIDAENLDAFGKELGYKEGDLINKIDGVEVSFKTFKFFKDYYLPSLSGDEIMTIEVLRKNKKGKYKAKQLSAKVRKVDTITSHVTKIIDNPTPAQLKLRNQWLDK